VIPAHAITPRLKIPPDALVLDIGSGHRPHPRANLLSDRYLEDRERGGALVTDRSFVQIDSGRLPFKSKVFDFIICRHVLEHVEDPEIFLNEMGRIGMAGYIESPSLIWEMLHPSRSYHRWWILEIESELVLMEKKPTHEAFFGCLFETLNTYSPEYRLFLRRYAQLFHVRHFWKDHVAYSVNPDDDQRKTWFFKSWDKQKVDAFVTPRSSGQQALELIWGALESVWGGE